MRNIIASTFVTLDGVMEAPGSGDTTLLDKRGWSEPFMSEEIGMLIMSQMQNSDAMLLGRKTYQDFAAFWPSQPDENPFAQFMNNQPKYVVSNTLKKAEWKNSTLMSDNIAAEISKLKQQSGKNISITGSGGLINSLMQLDLIDTYQLMICPVVLGVGKHLFKEGSTKTLKLVESRSFSSGMLLLTYEPVRS